jgi:hypothetical protein
MERTRRERDERGQVKRAGTTRRGCSTRRISSTRRSGVVSELRTYSADLQPSHEPRESRTGETQDGENRSFRIDSGLWER